MTIIESNKYNLAEQIEKILIDSDNGETISITRIDDDQSEIYAISKAIDTEPPICNNSNN